MPKTATPHKPAAKCPSPTTEPAPKAPRTTKQAQVLDLLWRPGGATTQELMEATGWQAHTVRAVISGLKKGKSGKRTVEQVDIRSQRVDGQTIYEAAA